MDDEPLSREGAALLTAGRPLDAVEVLRHGVATGEPSAPDLLARAYLDSGSWHAAVEWLGPLVEQGHVRFAGRLGVALVGVGNREDAEDALRLAVRSGEVAAANDLSILLRDTDRLAEAIQVLEHAAEAGDRQAPSNVVALFLDDGDLPSASAAAERWADDTNADSVLALAEVRASQARIAEAESLYYRAAELGALRAHLAYGQFLLAARGDVDGAERQFAQARRHEEPNWAAVTARFLLDEGRTDEAREYLRAAVDAGDGEAAQTLRNLDDPWIDE